MKIGYTGCIYSALFPFIVGIFVSFLNDYHSFPLILAFNGLNYHLNPNKVSYYIDVVTVIYITIYTMFILGKFYTKLFACIYILIYFWNNYINKTPSNLVHIFGPQLFAMISLYCGLNHY